MDGVDPVSKDNDGRTPLSWATEYSHGEVVELLLAKSAVGPDPEDNGG